MMTIALLLLLSQATTTTTTQTPVPPPQATSPGAAALDDYNIGVADVITVTVFGEPDASRSRVTVDSDGTIDMPLIGRVKVAGKPSRTAEKEIHDKLERYLVNPSVSIQIDSYRSKSVFVQGYVRDPGEKILEGNASLTSVLAKAGSMSIDAASYLIVSRRGPNNTTVQFRVTRKQIESGEAQNILLQDGDTVLVPKAETFFISGNVRSTGSFTWDEGLTVERALALAGGATERAGKIDITRAGKTLKNVKKSDLVMANDNIKVKQRIF